MSSSPSRQLAAGPDFPEIFSYELYTDQRMAHGRTPSIKCAFALRGHDRPLPRSRPCASSLSAGAGCPSGARPGPAPIPEAATARSRSAEAGREAAGTRGPVRLARRNAVLEGLRRVCSGAPEADVEHLPRSWGREPCNRRSRGAVLAASEPCDRRQDAGRASRFGSAWPRPDPSRSSFAAGPVVIGAGILPESVRSTLASNMVSDPRQLADTGVPFLPGSSRQWHWRPALRHPYPSDPEADGRRRERPRSPVKGPFRLTVPRRLPGLLARPFSPDSDHVTKSSLDSRPRLAMRLRNALQMSAQSIGRKGLLTPVVLLLAGAPALAAAPDSGTSPRDRRSEQGWPAGERPGAQSELEANAQKAQMEAKRKQVEPELTSASRPWRGRAATTGRRFRARPSPSATWRRGRRRTAKLDVEFGKAELHDFGQVTVEGQLLEHTFVMKSGRRPRTSIIRHRQADLRVHGQRRPRGREGGGRSSSRTTWAMRSPVGTEDPDHGRRWTPRTSPTSVAQVQDQRVLRTIPSRLRDQLGLSAHLVELLHDGSAELPSTSATCRVSETCTRGEDRRAHQAGARRSSWPSSEQPVREGPKPAGHEDFDSRARRTRTMPASPNAVGT